MLTATQKSEITKRVEELIHEANERYGTNIAVPKVLFNRRLRTTAGRAHYTRLAGEITCDKVDFHTDMAADNYEDFMQRTVPHETAHVVAMMAFSHRGHGEPWKRVMRDFGYKPTRCHDYDVTKYTNRKKVQCKGCGNVATAGPVVYKRIANGNISSRKYFCALCKSGDLVPCVGEEVKKTPTVSPTHNTAAQSKNKRNDQRQRRAGSKISKAIDIVKQMLQTHNEDSIVEQIMHVCNLKHNMARRYMKEAMQEIKH